MTPPRRLIAASSLLLALGWTTVLAARQGGGVPEMEPLDCVINPSVVADLGSGSPGILLSVHVDRSDYVNAGDVIAELESGVENASVELAAKRAELNAEVDLRRVHAAFGQRQRQRTNDLFERKVISTNDMDERETEARLARIQLRQALDNQALAKLELARAEEILNRRTIRTPITGVVMERFKVVGEYVEDQPVARVAQLDPLHVEVIVPVEQLGKIKPGMHARVWADAVTGEKWSAIVSRVDRVADVASATYGVRLTMPNEDYEIPAGLRCRMQFVAGPAFLPGTTSAEREMELVRPPDQSESRAPVPAVSAVMNAKPVVAGGPEKVEREPLVAETMEPEPVAEEAPDVAVAASDPVVDEESGPKDEKGPLSLPSSPQCYLAGPFKDEMQATKKVVAVRRAGFYADIKSFAVDAQTEYKVLTPLLSDRARADEVVDKLKAAGFTDYYVPRRRKGPLRIYLGLYHHQRYADERIQELAAMGVKAELRKSGTSTSEFYLVIRGIPNQELKEILATLPLDKSRNNHGFCNQLAGG